MEERDVKMTIDQAKIMFEGDNQVLRDIALKTFPELNKSRYPMSHDELQDRIISEETYWIDDESDILQVKGFSRINGDVLYNQNRNIILSLQRAKEYLAFTQLIALRDKWNEIDEFEPDWKDSKNKYCIILISNEIVVETCIYRSRPLNFGKSETAYLFANTFRNLIKQAKNLI